MSISRRKALQLLAAAAAYPSTKQGMIRADRLGGVKENAALREIHAPGITIGLTPLGKIEQLKLGTEGIEVAFRASTVLVDCKVKAAGAPEVSADGGVEFTNEWVHRVSGASCRVVERFTPAGSSIRWDLEIAGAGAPWSTAIQTRMAWPKVAAAKFWTACDRGPGKDANWKDPLMPFAFGEVKLRYGSYIDEPNGFCLPLLAVLQNETDNALSFVQSPESLLLDMQLTTSAGGDVVLSRKNHRICSGAAVRFAMDLVPHEADWRSGLGWMTKRYPGYFHPPAEKVYALDGCGAYSAYQGELDCGKLRKMEFQVNWNAHFDFPFHGMMIPPVTRDTVWNSWYGKPASLARMSGYDTQMKRDGFDVLEYFVLTECGNYISHEKPERKARADDDLWLDADDYIYYAIPEAVMRKRTGEIQYSNWFDNVVVDPAEPVWRDALIGQIQRLIRELPDAAGVCIDRTDWLTLYNERRDDGVSWVNGRAARSLLVSWAETGSQVAALLHQAGKFVYVNPLVRRVDTYSFVDGLYDEYGDLPGMLNLTAFLAVYKPAIGWTRDADSLRPDPDAFFQRHLHLGVFPMAPYPDADHSIGPDPWAEKYFVEYGPLLGAMRGKRWVLEPHVISVAGDRACVNLFRVRGGYAIPVTFARSGEVTVILGKVVDDAPTEAVVLWPGGEEVKLQGDRTSGGLEFRVPVKRGCGMLQLRLPPPSKPAAV
ncbi:MAG TPA: hypothetical protein VMH20_11840 [Verrucomicrobiae bacterium]|nr:hypothetical protein [Verrucomicrobiae bacterium]